MNVKDPQIIITALAEMKDELSSVKSEAENMKDEISELDVNDLELPIPMPGSKMEEDNKAQEGRKTEKNKSKMITTPEEAKSVLNEAKNDLQNVIDNLDAICGQAEEEIKSASYKRIGEKYASELSLIGANANSIIQEARHALNHWSFLVDNVRLEKSLTNHSLRQAAQTVKEVSKFNKLLQSLGFKKESTAVPPTGAKFTGDKWPDKGDPAKVELNAWEKGSNKFQSDKKFEDKRPNPAVDNRLTDVDYNRFGDDKPFINASFNYNSAEPFNSYWQIRDLRNGRVINASFKDVPAHLGPKNLAGLKAFGSRNYGRKLVNEVSIAGLDAVKSELNAIEVGPSARRAAVENRDTTRRYFVDAFGDRNYAKDLTSGDRVSKLPVSYKPKDNDPNKKVETTKEGPGKISKVLDKEIIQAKARKAVELARRFAASGAIPFTKQSIASKAEELLELTDAAFKTVEATLQQMPIVNQAALKESHLPETETGVVNNTATGIQKPKQQINSEGINFNVKSDGKIAKQASFVPQTPSDGVPQLELSQMFTTTAKALLSKGVDLSKLRKPQYKM